MVRFAILAGALALLVSKTNGFSSSQFHQRSSRTLSKVPFVKPLFMSEEPKEGTTVSSGSKELGYDENSGRFFETGLDDAECIPEEEYCLTDEKTGKLIRLTLEEKERIFLDALQVRTL